MPLNLRAGNLDAFYAGATSLAGAARRLPLEAIAVAPDALPTGAEFAAAGRTDARVVLVHDETLIVRDGEAVKPLVAAAFRDVGHEVAEIEIHDPVEVHTTPAHIETVRSRLAVGDVVVALGSGTIVDIVKHAVHLYEAANPSAGIRLVSFQTANSVCAFTSGLAVVTTDSVKRTVPSRLPNGLLLDEQLLAQAPVHYTLGGIGDASVAASSFADYRLVALLGLGSWEPLSWSLMEPVRTRFLQPTPGPIDAGELGLDLAACGLAMTYAGDSAPLSGLEHVTSHMLDMAAAHHGRPVGNHGSQCGLATILTLIAYEKLMSLSRLDIDVDGIDDDAALATVRAVFGPLDSDGRVWRECWHDYRIKLDLWRENRAQVQAFARDWETHRADLLGYLVSPADFVAALASRGHPLRFEDIPTGLTEEHARWAFASARLMRKRTSVADLLAFAGVWDDAFVDDIFGTYHALISPIKRRSRSRPARIRAKELP